jgi:hypothetical protein
MIFGKVRREAGDALAALSASAAIGYPSPGGELSVGAHVGGRRASGRGGNGRQKMFEKDEVLKELHARLAAAGINPLDPKVQAISEVVNAFYAEKTREVLEKMQEVLSKIQT